MKSKLLLCLAIAGLAAASAKSYTVSLFEPVMVGKTELKPGDYKVEVVDQKAIVRNGKVEVQSPVKVENGDTKFSTTSVRVANAGGKMRLVEIRLGGTNTKLVLGETGAD